MISMNRVIGAVTRRLLQGCVGKSNRQTSSVSNRPPRKSDSNPSLYRTSKFDKWLLEHFKKFPKGETPDFVPEAVMERYRSLGRIKLNVAMGIACLVGILAMIYVGKKERAAGYSVHQMNLDWHSAEQNKLDPTKTKG